MQGVVYTGGADRQAGSEGVGLHSEGSKAIIGEDAARELRN